MDDLSAELCSSGCTGTCQIHLYNMTSFSAPLDNTVAEEKVDFSSTCYIKTSVEYQMMKEKNM
jgi:imidazoleglycerol phosphate dehydratase HisB